MADSPDIWIYNSMQLQGLNRRVKGRRFCTVGPGPGSPLDQSGDLMLRFVAAALRAGDAVAVWPAGASPS